MQSNNQFGGPNASPKNKTNPLEIVWLGASIVGAFMTKGKKEKNATKLDDLKVSSSTYGKGIAEVFGTMKVSGNMIWSTDFREIKHIIGKKGEKGDNAIAEKKVKKGAAQEVYEYRANFAMALCAGVMESVIRIWADQTIIYDRYNPDKAKAPGFSEPEEQNSGKTGKKNTGSTKSGEDKWVWRFYSGTEEQMPDPFMVKTQGATKVPAHRGLCYLFFEDMPLKDFGNRTPTITAEVVAKTNRRIEIKPFLKLPPGAPTANGIPSYNGCNDIAIDPTRYEIVQYTNTFGDREFGDGNVRVWSIENGHEMVRFRHDHAFRGVDGNGDIVSNTNAGNSQPIGYFDTRKGYRKRQIGGYSIGLDFEPNSDRYAALMRVMPYYGLELDAASGKAKGSVETLYEGIFQVAMVTRKRTATHVQNDGTGVFANLNGYRLWPSEPESLAGTHYLISNSGYVHRFVPKPKFGDFSKPITDWKVKTFFTGLNLDDGGIGDVTVTPPVFMAGTREYLRLTAIHRGKNAGLYVQVFDLFWKELWRRKIAGPEQFSSVGLIMDKGWPNFDILPMSSNDKFAFIEGRYLYVIKVGARDVEMQLLPENFPAIDAFQVYLSASNSILIYGTERTGGVSNTTFFQLFIEKYLQYEPTVADICARVCEACGLTRDQYDVSDLTSLKIGGYLHDNPAPGRQVIEDLATTYLFDVAEIDYKLVFRRRGRQAAVTIPERMLGIVGDAEENNAFVETRTQEIELAQTVIVNYIDMKDDYTTKSQHYRRPISPQLGMQSSEQIDINLPIPMSADVAKQLAEKVLFSAWAERTTRDYVLPWDYLIYDATDVLRIALDDGLTFNDRALKFDVGADLSIEMSAVSEYAAAYSSDAVGVVSGGRIDRGRQGTPGVAPIVLDIPFVDDDDRNEVGSQLPLYWGAAPNKEGFRFASLGISRPGGDSKSAGSTMIEAVTGSVLGTIPAPPNGPFATDDKTVIRLMTNFDYEAAERFEWEPIPHELWPSYDNMLWVDGEIILFRDVAVQEDGTILVSHLIRGHRGTEAWAVEHAAGSPWCLLNVTGIQLTSLPVTALNEAITARMGAPSPLQLMAPIEEFTFRANGTRPYAPNDIRRKDNDDGSVTLTWERRTRFEGELRAVTGDVPLHEEEEHYTVLILTEPLNDLAAFDPFNLPDTVKRRIDTDTTRVTYEMAEQIADGTAGQTLHVLIVQRSNVVGLGLPTLETLPKVRQSYRV